MVQRTRAGLDLGQYGAADWSGPGWCSGREQDWIWDSTVQRTGAELDLGQYGASGLEQDWIWGSTVQQTGAGLDGAADWSRTASGAVWCSGLEQDWI
jgi:hypothetical protein